MPDLLDARWLWTGVSWVCFLLLTLWLLALLFPIAIPRDRNRSIPREERNASARQGSPDDSQPAGSPLARFTHQKEYA